MNDKKCNLQCFLDLCVNISIEIEIQRNKWRIVTIYSVVDWHHTGGGAPVNHNPVATRSHGLSILGVFYDDYSAVMSSYEAHLDKKKNEPDKKNREAFLKVRIIFLDFWIFMWESRDKMLI